MSVSLNASAPSTASLNASQGVWNDPATQAGTGVTLRDTQASNGRPGSTGDVLAVDKPSRGALGDAVQIDGSSAGTKVASGKTPDGKEIVKGNIHDGAQVDITRERTVDGGYVTNDQLVLTTGTGNDKVGVTQRDNGTLDVVVNGESYEVKLAEGQELTVRSGAGNDVIDVAANVKVNVVVEGGAGDDIITTGAGDDRVDGGAGNDTIKGNGGRDDLFGNSGDDRIEGGAGDDVVYGGDGVDVLAGNDGVDFLEGGKGNDALDGGLGQDILSGGQGDDALTGGAGNDRVYSGAGKDTINAETGDVLYSKTSDLVNAANGAKPTVVNVVISANEAVTLEGSDSFKQRVGAEIDLLRSSPNGQQMLAEFDKAAAKGNTVTIRELANEQNGYAQTLGRANSEITNGKAGTGSDVIISYNPSFHMDAFPAPVGVLFHEMSHAYNGVTGTFQPGTYSGPGPDKGGVPNAERQAVGLETTAKPFDFDNNPATPPTTHNPDALSENGLRTEMGLPLRPNYTL